MLPINEKNIDEDLERALFLSLINYTVKLENKIEEDKLLLSCYEWEKRRQHGDWECTQCTLSNPIRNSICELCGNLPPFHVATYAPVHPHIRFGVEFELFLKNAQGWSPEDVSLNLSQAGVNCRYEKYTHRVTKWWKIVTDRSIKTPNPERDVPFELVSPILIGSDGIAEVINVLKILKKLGVSTNKSTGFHIHVDGNFFSFEELKKVVSNFCQVESALDLCVPHNRRGIRNRYAKSNREAFGIMTSKQRYKRVHFAKTRNDLINICNPSGDRYFKLNLLPMMRQSSTIEFRHSGGTSSHVFAEAWVRLILQFCESSRSKVPLPFYHDMFTTQQEICLLLQFISSNAGLVDFFTRKIKKLEKKPWQCLNCKKKFATSRQLQQHRFDSPKCSL